MKIILAEVYGKASISGFFKGVLSPLAARTPVVLSLFVQGVAIRRLNKQLPD
jgi:hypothetical protein